MILTYHEGACIRASAGDTTIVFGPVAKTSKHFKPTNFGANVAFISLNHPDMNGADEASRGEKEAFVIAGPGEYEISGIAVAAFPTGSKYGGEERVNTAYSLTFDGISLLYLGALGENELPKDLAEMDAPDIVFIPVGGGGVLSPAEAQKLVVNLEPKLVIPMLYDLPAQAGDKTLKQFLKEAGEEKVTPIDKLTLKPRDLVGKEGDVVVLAS